MFMYVCIFFFKAEAGIGDLTVTGVQTCALPILRLLRGIWSVSRLVRRERYDVVNTTSRRDTLIAAAGARLGGTPLVVRSRQIGRASCRGKSVDLGGRRIIKKKKNVS